MELSSEECLNTHLTDVNIDLLLQAISGESIPDILKNSVAGTSYTFTKRLSVNQLCERFTSSVKEAQTSYIASIKAAEDELKINVKMCEQMDNLFGKEYEDETEESFLFLKSKDGSRLLRCPLQNCSTKTFKLRRHLRDVHSTLSDEGQDLAVLISQKFERNKAILAIGEEDLAEEEGLAEEEKKKKSRTNLNLVARKDNYKACVLCGHLYLNLPDHVVKFHKIQRTDPHYDRYVRDPVTIPRCYTKSLNGKIVALTGVELEEAKKEFDEIVETQENELQTRKRLREEILKVTNAISVTENEEELEKLNEELCNHKVKYNASRYPDIRVYTENVELWKNSYLDFLQNQTLVEPQRLQRMAMDVFLEYEKDSGKSLTFNDISKPLTVKSILGKFRECKNILFLSKLKYVGQFSNFIEYLLISIESPEVSGDETQQEMAARGFKYEQIKSEIKKELAILNKMKGKDVIQKNKKAKSKLVTDEEIQSLLASTKAFLKEVQGKMTSGLHLQFTRKEVTKVRDSLIAVATVRLGRRSLEMTRMTLQEVHEATESVINDDKYFTINVAEQKNTHTGKPAPVVYDEVENSVLLKFITDLRPTITSDNKCIFVFPAYPKLNSKQNQLLGLSVAFKILQKFQTASRKKISSRTLRGSKVTNSRQQNCSEEHLNHLANSMSHSRSTADSYYDFSSVHNSVAHVLGNDSSNKEVANKICSTPNKSSVSSDKSTSIAESSPNISNIVTPDSAVPSTSGVVRKRKVTFDTSSDDSECDQTLFELRSKKVKSCSYDHKLLEEEVVKILRLLKEKNMTDTLFSKNGTISVKQVSKELPVTLKSASTKEYRSLIKNLL